MTPAIPRTKSERSGFTRLCSPSSIVVIGASSNPLRVAGRPLSYLTRFGYRGQLFAVNPGHRNVQGVPSYPSIEDLPIAPELAIITLAADHAVDAAQRCGRMGVRAAVILASGFAEEGAVGRERQAMLQAIVDGNGMRILGPNSLGFRDVERGIMATFATDIDSGIKSGPVAIVAQSGGLGGYLGAVVPREVGLGVRYFFDTGNEADIDVAECVDYLARQDDIQVIGLLMEGCKDGYRLRGALETAQANGKPVVALKIGRSARGQAAVQSHTGTLVGDDAAYSALFTATGALRAANEEEFVHALRLLAMPKRPGGRGVGILTQSGGAGTLFLDHCEKHNLLVPDVALPPLHASGDLPAFQSSNPLDLSGQLANSPQAVGPLLAHLLAQSPIDSVIMWCPYGLLSDTMGDDLEQAIQQGAASSDKPTYLVGMAERSRQERLHDAGVATFTYPAPLVQALARVISRSLSAVRDVRGATIADGAGLQAMPCAPESDQPLPGIPTVPSVEARTAQVAQEVAESLGYPVVVKGEVRDIIHKSERGLVATDLWSGEAVRHAFDAVNALCTGSDDRVVVQPQLRGIEMYVGAKRDHTFGPVVVVGMGGVFVEILRDTVTSLAPVCAVEVHGLLQRLQGYPILAGARARHAWDLTALCTLVARLSQRMVEDPEIREVDLNPVILLPEGEGCYAVDVVVVRDDAVSGNS